MGRGYLNERATGGAVKPSPDVGGRFGRGKVPSLGKEGRVVVKKGAGSPCKKYFCNGIIKK
jgi:hypothetical protein